MKRECGDGWRFMVPAVRVAMIESRALAIVCGQHAETVRVDDVQKLRVAMLEDAGLADENGLIDPR